MDKKTVSIVVASGLGLAFAGFCFMGVKEILEQRKFIKDFAEQTGMSYKSAKIVLKSARKNEAGNVVLDMSSVNASVA